MYLRGLPEGGGGQGPSPGISVATFDGHGEVSGGDAELISTQSDDNRLRVYLDPECPPPGILAELEFG